MKKTSIKFLVWLIPWAGFLIFFLRWCYLGMREKFRDQGSVMAIGRLVETAHRYGGVKIYMEGGKSIFMKVESEPESQPETQMVRAGK